MASRCVRSVVGFLVLVSASGLPALGWDSEASVVAAGQYNQGRLEGRVTDTSGAPVVGIEVNVDGVRGTGPSGTSVLTDSQGYYRFETLTTSAYVVWIDESNHGFLPQAWEGFTCEFFNCGSDPLDGRTWVGVVSGETTSGIDFVLQRPARISVNFDDPVLSNDVVFNAMGDYEPRSMFGKLLPGTYFVVAFHEEDYGIDELYAGMDCPSAYGFPACDPTTGTPVVVMEGEHRTLEMSRRQGGRISGRVEEALTGDDVFNGWLQVWNLQGEAVASDSVSGQYFVGDLPTGQYYVTVSAAAWFDEKLADSVYPGRPCPNPPSGCSPSQGTLVSVVEGETTSGVDFSLDRAGTVEATVVGADSGFFLDGRGVRVWGADGRLVHEEDFGYQDIFQFHNLPAGSYYATTFARENSGERGYFDQVNDGRVCDVVMGCDLAASTPITVVAGEITTVTFVLDPYGGIEGVSSGAYRRRVVAWSLDGSEAGSTHTNNGEYRFETLPPGSYRLSTRTVDQFGDLEGIDELHPEIPCPGGPGVGCALSDGAVVSFAQGQHKRVDFALEPGAAISGSVRVRATGEPLDWYRATAYNASGLAVGEYRGSYQNGFRLSGLTAGQYFIGVESFNPALLPSVFGYGTCLECDPTLGTPIEVTDQSETTGIDLELDFGSLPTTVGVTLLGGRFLVEGTMQNFDEPPVSFEVKPMVFGDGRAESDQAVFFESFSSGNFELGVKMVDGCGLPENHPLRSYWLFVGGLTNAESHVRVEDSVSGEVLEWENTAGSFPETYANTAAFPCTAGASSCVRSEGIACLLGNRFRVSGSMWNFEDPPIEYPARVMTFGGDGTAVTSQAAFFESFNLGNFEVGVKMVDACDLPAGNPLRGYWTFYGGLTNAATDLRVTQLSTGAMDRWTVDPGALPTSVGRTPAFGCE